LPKKTSIGIFNFQNLHKACLNCRKNKRRTYHAAKFEINFEKKILKLEEELKNQSYSPIRSICFVVENPVLREIFAGAFRDRVIHHLLYNFLENVFEPKFIEQSYACRKNKGNHKSLKDLKKYLLKASKNNAQKIYFLHLDIKAFFMSLNKQILFEIISSKVNNPKILWLCKTVIFNDPTKNFVRKGDLTLFEKIPKRKSLFGVPSSQGLPIGNLTSQFFANVYMNELDSFVKRKLKAKYYMRYVDDFLLISKNIKELKLWKLKIKIFLKERLKLELNEKKQILESAEKGIDWLGYIVKPRYVLVRKRVVESFKNKLFAFNKNLEKYQAGKSLKSQIKIPFLEYEPSYEELQKMLAVINSYHGHFKHAHSYNLKKHIWESHFKELKKYFEPKDKNFSCFKIKESVKLKNQKSRRTRDYLNSPLPGANGRT
jgi:RNA-directed DNA polymerase